MTDAVQLVRKVLDCPIVEPAWVRWKHRQFLSKSAHSACFGVFKDFAEARASLPPSREFDDPALAKDYVEVRTKRVFAYDYPVMWWLEKAFLGGAANVLDIGGSVGVHYYAYQRYVALPPNVRWHVVEVPAMVKIGREMAAQQQVGALEFTEHLEPSLEGSDVWIAAGSIQYIENARPSDLLRRCTARPRHILLNKLPLYAGEDFVTTQNLGEGAFAPLYIWNRERYIQDIVACGYELRDAWSVLERSLYLPGHRRRSVSSFSGLYFKAGGLTFTR